MHSKSPDIHHQFADQVSHSISYNKQLIDIEKFERGVSSLIEEGICGANVTVPFKQQAWELAEKKSETAQVAGAVNTLTFKDGVIFGDNTDGVGLVRDLTNNHGQQIKGKRVLILGAGGAVRGVLQDIINQEPQEIVIANRTQSKAQQLAELFNEGVSISACEFDKLEGKFDLIINGTSASLNNELPPVSDAVIGSNTVCYDMMYSDNITVFNRWAKSCGASQCFDGLGMLIEQAAESFWIWRDVRPDTSEVINRLRSKS
jgi:shikimate dehydrogenase